MDCRPFHAGYAGGRKLFFGGDTELLEELEVLASGMSMEGPVNNGPVVHRRDNGGWLIAWIWSEPAEVRGGAVWSAWGVTGGLAIEVWPWHYTALSLVAAQRKSPDSSRATLESIAQGIASSSYKGKLPQAPERLFHLARSFHLDHISKPTATFRVPIHDKQDLALLPWLWLLGPIPPSEATVGPPKRNATIVKHPIVYEGSLVDDVQGEIESSSPFLRDVAFCFHRHPSEAFYWMTQLRQQPASIRREWLNLRILRVKTNQSPSIGFPKSSATKISVAKRTPDTEISGLPESGAEPADAAPAVVVRDPQNAFLDAKSRNDFLEGIATELVQLKWGIVALAAVNLSALLVFAFYISSLFDSVETTTRSTASSQAPANTASPSDKDAGHQAGSGTVRAAGPDSQPSESGGEFCKAAFTDAESQSALMNAVVKRTDTDKIKLSQGVKGLAKRVPWSEPDGRLAAAAALQMSLVRAKCVPSGFVVDGIIGEGTIGLIKICPQVSTALDTTSANSALADLCKWATSPQNRAQ